MLPDPTGPQDAILAWGGANIQRMYTSYFGPCWKGLLSNSLSLSMCLFFHLPSISSLPCGDVIHLSLPKSARLGYFTNASLFGGNSLLAHDIW